MWTIHLIVAARPNFMKVAPLYHALKSVGWANPVLIHTGQHYDLNMSDVFFQDLGLPEPDIHLGIGGGTHAEQTGSVMIEYEKILYETMPDFLVVVGDVNATMACTLAAMKVTYNQHSHSASSSGKLAKTRPVIGHLEAGLRSFDRSMPEEINRIVTDSLADVLWTPSPDGDDNLRSEGVDPDKIVRVGNIMLDSFEMLRNKIESESVLDEIRLDPGSYAVVTLHRPANVDVKHKLELLCKELVEIANDISICFPIHPRTKKNLLQYDLLSVLEQHDNIIILEPQNYIRFMSLVINCQYVITDSGGIQEETTYLGIPCLTIRPNTERPITVEMGTNVLCEIDNFRELAGEISNKYESNKPQVIDLWDGKTSGRVVESINKILMGR
ncbi:MAG: UDP-N-acetylglucosamine 2-epimerase (non-hydrolyzing) [Candidatus Thiodiazotropha sp.]